MLLLLLSINPTNAVRFSVLTDGEFEIAVKCKPHYEDDESLFLENSVARFFFPVYAISPYKYMKNANFEVTQFQVLRLGVFNIAWPKVPVG